MKILLITAAVAAIIYFFYKRGKKVVAQQSTILDLSQVKVETLDGELKMEDVVSILKSHNLNQTLHTPFIVSNLSDIRVKPEGFFDKPGYVPLVIGVFHESKDNIRLLEVIFAKSYNERLQKVLSTATNDNPFIVLS